METTTRRNGRISTCGWPMDGQWTANGWSTRMQASCRGSSSQKPRPSVRQKPQRLDPGALSAPLSFVTPSRLALAWTRWSIGLEIRRPARTDLAKAWGPGIRTMADSLVFASNAQCSGGSSSSSSSTTFRALAFTSTPKRTTMLRPRRPPNLCHPSSCLDLQVQAAKDG